MKKQPLIYLFFLMLWSNISFASSGGMHLHSADIDMRDNESLKRGAETFVNYCLSCHSAQYHRFERMADDLGLDKEYVIHNMMHSVTRIGDTMTVAMPAEDAKEWFGNKIPDLSLVARSKGVDWLYTYLLSFYLDDSKATGVNNLLFKDVGMPHVLWKQQGYKKAIYEEETKILEKDDGSTEEVKVQVIKNLETAVAGQMNDKEYEDMVRDLVNFLAYIAEPAKMYRQELGVYVLLFLAVFFVFAYLLKKEYWKDVH
jgi:ubiquinol-cytochrome c reductase cytochrome c1 subunit